MNGDRYDKITTVVKYELLYALSIGVFTFDLGLSLPILKVNVNVMHILTANISQMAINRPMKNVIIVLK